MRWLADNEARAEGDPFATCEIVSVEPSESMRRMADAILDGLARQMGKGGISRESYGVGIEELALPAEKFDLIVFSTMFDYLDGRRREEMIRNVTNLVDQHLGVWGLVLFIVPKQNDGEPESKWSFVQQLGEELARRPGFRWCRPQIGEGLQPPNDGVQHPLQELRARLYDEALRPTISVQLYPKDPQQVLDEYKPHYAADVYPLALRRTP